MNACVKVAPEAQLAGVSQTSVRETSRVVTGCLDGSTDLKLEHFVFTFGCPAAEIREQERNVRSKLRWPMRRVHPAGIGGAISAGWSLSWSGRGTRLRPITLPLQLSSFVGREKELAEIRRLLEDALPARWAPGRGRSRRDRRRGLTREGNAYLNYAYRARCYPGDRRPGWRWRDRAGGSPGPLRFPLRPRGQRKETARARDASTRCLPRCG